MPNADYRVGWFQLLPEMWALMGYDVAREPVNYIQFIQGCMRMRTRELARISVLMQRS